MPLAVRVIACLDVHDGRVVKGVNFQNLRDAGDPVELGHRYGAEGADELIFLDVSASAEGRATMREVVARTAETVFIPLTVGGGLTAVDDVDRMLRSGADKVGINTAGIHRPELIDEIARRFGNQVLVVAWVREAVSRGAGEILLNSMDADGTTAGFDLEMIRDVRAVVDVPLIASGGAGAAHHFVAAVQSGADAVLAASVFHYQTLTIAEVKQALAAAGYPVRTMTEHERGQFR